MADYNGHPDCRNCEFFRQQADNGRQCSKHDFIMPTIDWHMACSDWQRQGKKIKDGKIDKDVLYYYSYSTGEVLTAEFASFKDLQNPILSVSIRLDHELGWVIYPRRQFQFFPEPERTVSIQIQNQEIFFQTVNVERKVAAEMIPVADGEWDTQYHTEYVFMLCSQEAPDLLYEWLGKHIDIERYKIQRNAPSLFAFIEVIEDQRHYALHFDDLAYQKYQL